MSRLTSIILVLGFFFPVQPLSGAGPDFREEIQPILETHCLRCHNDSKTKGGLRLDTFEKMMEGGDTAEAVVPGQPKQSELLIRIHLRPIDEGVMPDEGKALRPEEVTLLDAWVEAGAPWPTGITLTERKPPAPREIPLPETPPASLTEAAAVLDEVIRRENAVRNLPLTAPIDDLAFLRRATIDLIGRIPTHDEIEAFEDGGPDRRARLIEKLTAHPRFADRWTIFMADLLRIRSNVTGGNQLLAYVHGSLREGKPYDVLVRELISASGRAEANPAVGYILGDDADPMELAAATSQVFLGVRMGCAMCHDHPFDDWKQQDFYDLAAFFGKTKQVRNRRGSLYTTEDDRSRVLWPPEGQAEPEKRRPVDPRFPFLLEDPPSQPHHLRRFEKHRLAREKDQAVGSEEEALDALLDAVEPSIGPVADPVLAEAREESRQLKVHQDLYRSSELRTRLADLITDPRNDFFARSFVNRVWAELLGHGFVEPLDNFSDYNEIHHPAALKFLAREFIASGYDLRSLVHLITLSETYQRSALPPDTPVDLRERSERNFAAAPTRRMLSEVLYDSIVVAGHLENHKWPAGANPKEVARQVRVPTGESTMVEETSDANPAMMSETSLPRNDGYDLESSLKIDFNSILSSREQNELASMRQQSDEQIAAEKRAARQREQQRRVMTYETKTVTETIDDNPRFDSAMRMATPAPPSHFLRVFGQPARTGLGEFRDDASSLRQQLMMLNGRLTHEASRVGTLEPLHHLLQKDQDLAIERAYREILTRRPTAEENSDARAIVNGTPEGLADLRWALLNSNEFRFLP